MSTFKKLFASIAAVMIVVSTAPVAVFGQTSWSTEYQDAYAFAFANGITTMSSINGARLADTTTRAEFAKMASAYAENVLGLEANTSANCSFSDLAPVAGTDLADFAVKACQYGLMGINTNGIFNPMGVLSRAEAFTVISRMFYGDLYNGGNPWYSAHMNALNQAGLVNDLSNPTRPIIRGDVMLVLKRSSEADLSVTPSICSEIETVFACTIDADGSMGLCPAVCLGGTTDPVDGDSDFEIKAGQLSVSLNAGTQPARTIPASGLVPFGKFDLSAGGADIRIGSITLKREGLSNRTDIRRVYLQRNGVRVSNRANITNDDEAMVSFSPAFVVKAGSTEALELVVELNSNTDIGAEHRFAILASNAINSSASTLGGSYPVRTNLQRIGSYVVDAFNVNGTLSTPVTYNVGETNVLLGQFTLSQTGTNLNSKDMLLQTVALRNEGTATAAAGLSNIALYRDGQIVSTNVVVNGRDITISANNELKDSASATYELRADVSGAERVNETYVFSIRNTSDVVLVEKESGFSAPIYLNNSLTAAYSIGSATIAGGDLLVSRDTQYPLNQTVSANTNNVVLWAANVNVTQGVSVEDVAVSFSPAGNGLQNFSSLRLIVGNSTVSTYSPAAGETGFVFDANFNVAANTKIRIEGNFRSTADSVFTIDSVLLGSTSVRYLSNDELASFVGSAQGITTDVSAAGLTATRNDNIDNTNIVVGATNVTLFGFSLRANDVSDVVVTSINPSRTPAQANGGLLNSQITNVRLFQGDTLLATRNDFNFNNLNVSIPQNQVRNFRIVADFASSVAAGSGITLTLGTGAAAVSARNASNASQTFGLNAPVSSRTFTFVSGGTVNVTSNSSQANASIVSPSSTEASVFKFDVEAKSDVLRVTDIYVQNVTGSLELASALSSASLSLGGQTAQASIIGTGVLHFAFGSNGVTLNPDQVVTADMKVAFSDSSSRTGHVFQFALPNTSITGQANQTLSGMRILSTSTGTPVGRTSPTAVASRTHLLSRSSVTVARQTESTASVAYKFTVTANANRRLELNQLHFNVAGLTGNASFTLRREGSNDSISLTGLTLSTAGTGVNFTSGHLSTYVDKQIAANATVTYVLEISGLDTTSAGNLDRTREVRIVNLQFLNDVASFTDSVLVADYNVLPTTASTFKY